MGKASAPGHTRTSANTDPSYLPDDIIREVASHLSTVDVVELRATSKGLRTAIPAPTSEAISKARRSPEAVRLAVKHLFEVTKELADETGQFADYKRLSVACSLSGTLARLFPGRAYQELSKKEQRDLLHAWRREKLKLLSFLTTPSDSQQAAT